MELFVSSPDCHVDTVVEWMRRCNLVGHVTATTNVRGDQSVEPGVVVCIHRQMGPAELQNAWSGLRDDIPDINCAHLVVPATYRGCIRGYLEPRCQANG